jgi:signal transduction histidine kinase
VNTFRNRLSIWSLFLLSGIFLYLTSLYSYLLFHSLVELYRIIIGCTLFVIIWNSRDFAKEHFDYLTFIGIAYFFVSIIDLVHMLEYEGMYIFNSGYYATELWIAARYMESISLAVLMILQRYNKPLKLHLLMIVYAFMTLSLIASILVFNVFPVCFIEGVGLTPFKIISEYVIILILIISALLLNKNKQKYSGLVYNYLLWSIIVTVFSELAFTLYQATDGLANFAGHILKVASFYLIYKAIIINCINEPYQTIFYELTENQQKAQNTMELLRRSDQNKNQFISMLSHELRNPMASITMGISILGRVPAGSEQSIQAQKIIERQTRHLVRLVDDLLDINRISQNKIILKKEQVDLNYLVQQTVSDYQVQYAAKKVSLQAILPSGPIYCDADPVRMHQVMGILLHNALKFTNAQGKVTIDVQKDEHSQEMIVRVSDTGIGIALETLPQVFEPFVQANTSLDRNEGGLGLGLAIAKGMVELHNGHITVHSEGIGRGTQFTIRLPLMVAVEEKESEKGAHVPCSRSLRILVIDDIPDIAEILCALLGQMGHETVAAYSGPEGIEKAKIFKPQVLLCDIGLPAMSGYEVAEHFRSDPELKNIVLLALSGYAQPDDIMKSKAAGFDHHLAKPVDTIVLEELLSPNSGLPISWS